MANNCSDNDCDSITHSAIQHCGRKRRQDYDASLSTSKIRKESLPWVIILVYAIRTARRIDNPSAFRTANVKYKSGEKIAKPNSNQWCH